MFLLPSSTVQRLLEVKARHLLPNFSLAFQRKQAWREWLQHADPNLQPALTCPPASRGSVVYNHRDICGRIYLRPNQIATERLNNSWCLGLAQMGSSSFLGHPLSHRSPSEHNWLVCSALVFISPLPLTALILHSYAVSKVLCLPW